jgi:hypothetical protein
MSAFSNLPNCSQQFQNDYQELVADAAKYSSDSKYAEEAMQQAQAAAINIDMQEYKGHPGELLVVLLTAVFGSSLDQAYQYQLGVTGDKVQIQSDLSKLTNDIQAAPNAAAVGGDAVQQVAAETDTMQDLLSSTGDATGDAVQSAIGGAAASFMNTNFANVRKDIYWKDDQETQYNPTEVTDPTTSGYTYHFVVAGEGASKTGYMTDYSQLAGNLALQGDTDGAQEANSILVNNYNQNVSTTQSLGTAVNSEIGMITSKIKANTDALSSFSQDLLTLQRTSVRNQVTQ